MGKYEEITEARKILGIAESETLKNIKDKFKELIKKYHPDVCAENIEISRKKTEKIIDAYKIIMDYCTNYKFSFNKDEIMKYISTQEFWQERFGNDPVWSSKFDKKNI